MDGCAGIRAKNNFSYSQENLKLGKIKEMAITRPFFELQTPDFAWMFVWTVQTNYGNCFWSGASEAGVSGASRGNSVIFRMEYPDKFFN